MRSGFLPARVVHVHPTRACNLACVHCYSDSSPDVRESLDAARILDALALLRAEGYEVVSISGGEPLVYRPLVQLAAGASALGFRVHMITNGILLSEERLAALAPYLFLMGVSLDGAEGVHNAVRGRDDAFRHARHALDRLARADTPFGIIYAVTKPSLADIPWAFELARELGARLLHLRPLAPEGRARALDDQWTLSPEDCARLFLLATLLDAPPPVATAQDANTVAHTEMSPRVQVDLVRAEDLADARSQFALLDPAGRIESLSDAINPLVLDADGRCYPFSHGIDPSLTVADIRQPMHADSFRPHEAMMKRLRDLLLATFLEGERAAVPFVDWFALLTRVSRQRAGSGVSPKAQAGHRP